MDNNLNINSMPHSAEAELAVLSAMLFDKEAIAIAYEYLDGNDFYRQDYRAFFEGMTELFTANRPIDVITLRDNLEANGLYDKAGGASVMMEIASGMASTANTRHYCDIILERSLRRKLIAAGQEISKRGTDISETADGLLEFAEKSIFNIATDRDSTDFVHIRDALAESIKKTQEAENNRINNNTGVTGIETGYRGIDKMTAGFQPGNLILIAARPSMGKSIMGLGIAQYSAIHNRIPTAFFALEMSKEELASRIICSEANVDAQRYKTGELSPDDWSKISDAAGPISEAPLYIDETAGITISELRAKCRRLKLEKGLGLIVVDYIQLMSGSRRAENRQQEISEISRSLKAIAREMNAPVVACAQLSRAPEQRGDKRPILSDLRESGAIEQDADVVSFIYRDEYYNKDTEKPGVAEIIIAKQRNGPTGTVELAFLGQYVKFQDIAYY